MAKVKYHSVEDLVDAVNSGELSIDNLKRMYYAALKNEQPRVETYRQAIYDLSLKKLKENWG